jgi:glycosyltransferase involved in cell wall biosynthesis
MSVQSIKTPLPGWRIEGASTSTFSDCSLIIATYQRPNEVLELVERIDELSSKPFEVIVVDGSPGWETEVKLRSWTAQVKADFDLTYVKCPAGLTRQRNAGIDLTSGNYVFFLDDDCLPQANYFAEIRRVFHKDTAGKWVLFLVLLAMRCRRRCLYAGVCVWRWDWCRASIREYTMRLVLHYPRI